MSKYIHVGFLLYFRGGFAMTWMNVVAMLVWTGASAVLLFAIMWVDSIFTKYNDLKSKWKYSCNNSFYYEIICTRVHFISIDNESK